MPRGTTIELVAADMEATLAFYRRLGLTIPEGAEREDHVETQFGGCRLCFDTAALIQSIDPSWRAPEGGHRAALAFECDDPGEVDRVYAELTSAGYHGHLERWDAFWGMRYAVVHDPDGTPVDLMAPLAG